MNATPPRFIYFDAGLTLLRPKPSVGYHYASVAAEFGAVADGDRLEKAFLAVWPALAEVPLNEPGTPPYGRTMEEAREFWKEIVRRTFDLAEQTLPHGPEFQGALFDRFAEAGSWELFPDVEPALRQLEERGVPWGILSNWDPRLRSILGGFGLLNRLEALVISAEVGVEKPSPAIFRAAEEACGGLPPESLALVGDNPTDDVAGAQAAGWRSFHVRRTRDGNGRGGTDLLDAVRDLLGTE